VARLVRLSASHRKIILYAVPGREAFYQRFAFRRMTTAMAIFEDQAKEGLCARLSARHLIARLKISAGNLPTGAGEIIKTSLPHVQNTSGTRPGGNESVKMRVPKPEDVLYSPLIC
jgi:hypothetical protein